MTAPNTLSDFLDHLQSIGFAFSTAAAYRGGVVRILRALPHPEAAQDRAAVLEAMEAAHAGLSTASRLHAQAGWGAYARFKHLPDPWTSEPPSIAWLQVVALLRKCGATWNQVAATTWRHVEAGVRYCRISPPGLVPCAKPVVTTEVLTALALQTDPSGAMQPDWQLCGIGPPTAPSYARVIARVFRDHSGLLPPQGHSQTPPQGGT